MSTQRAVTHFVNKLDNQTLLEIAEWTRESYRLAVRDGQEKLDPAKLRRFDKAVQEYKQALGR